MASTIPRRPNGPGVVIALVGAAIGLASGTASVVRTVQTKRMADAQVRLARREAERQENIERVSSARARLSGTRQAIVAAQAAQAEALREATSQRRKMTLLVMGSSMLVFTLIAMRR